MFLMLPSPGIIFSTKEISKQSTNDVMVSMIAASEICIRLGFRGAPIKINAEAELDMT
jgi:hypothetical protein